MAVDRELTCISLPAAANLSAYQFHIVAIDADGRCALPSGSVGAVIGVLQNKPAGTAFAAQVAISGVSRCYAGGSVAAGDCVKSDAAGLALVTTTAANTIVGRAISPEATGSGLIFEVLINPSLY